MTADRLDPSAPVSDARSSLRISLLRHRSSVVEPLGGGPALTEFLNPPMADDELGWLTHYRLLRPLGEGGMGTVFEAEDTILQRRVALKLLLPVHADNDKARERFLREARTLAALTHPHIVTVYEVGLARTADGLRDLPYLAMQLLRGESLAACLMRRGPLTVQEAVRLARQTAEGLAAAHALGVIHRDIKPANLWLEQPDASVKILDFGLARIGDGTEGQISTLGTIVGTPAFMAPEQARGDAIDARADLFSLGCVLYTALAGEVPFDAPSIMGILTRLAVYDPPPLHQRLPEVTPELSHLSARLLAKDPADRPASAQVLADRLRHLESHGSLDRALAQPTQAVTHSPTPTSIAIPPQPPNRRRFLLAGAATAGGLGLAGLAWWWNTRGSAPSGTPIRVGILHSQSGTMSASEVPVLEMTQLALEEINARGGLLGRPVEWVLGDGESRETAFAREAERLINEEGVVALFGCWTSASRKAVKEVVEAHRHLLFYPVQYEGLEQSQRIVYLGAAPNQQLLPAADWCLRERKKRTFLLVGSDYIFPRTANALLRHRLDERQAEVVGEHYVPLGSNDLGAVIAAIRATQPDAILNTINGDSNVAFFKALRQADVMPRETLIVSFSLDEQSLRGHDAAAVVGTYTAWNYFSALPGAINAGFKQRYRQRWGRHKAVTDPMEAAWLGVQFWAKAVEQCRRPDDLEAVRRCLGAHAIDAPEGKGVRLDDETQHTWKYFRVGRVVSGHEIEVVHEDDAPIPPVPYPKYRTPAQWEAWQMELYERWGKRWSAPSG